jgi:hypothetical protein
MKIEDMSIIDFALYVSDYLYNNGIEVVLSGGACVTIYTKNKYISYDLDFVLISYMASKRIKNILERIGFQEDGKYFKHKKSQYLIDFLSPPLSLGEEPVNEISKIKKGNKVLMLLSPTDCVKDRLAAYYHWNDEQSLDQALMVYKENQVDLEEVERWSLNEGMEEKFKFFRESLL